MKLTEKLTVDQDSGLTGKISNGQLKLRYILKSCKNPNIVEASKIYTHTMANYMELPTN